MRKDQQDPNGLFLKQSRLEFTAMVISSFPTTSATNPMMKKLKIVVDQAIPFVEHFFSSIAEIDARPASHIDRSCLLDADALIVRSVTPVNESLLRGTSVALVGSATIGIDHIDEDYLRRRAIPLAYAPGCNALAVTQYVLSAIASWALSRDRSIKNLSLGIVGVGAIGSQLAHIWNYMGTSVKVSDPPRHQLGTLPTHQSLHEWMNDVDVITVHTPLIRNGAHATYRLFDEHFFQQLPTTTLFINAARGELVEKKALINWIDRGGDAVLDVWPNEPNIDRTLLDNVFLGTPHIAGYSVEGKLNATRQLAEQFYRYLSKKYAKQADIVSQQLQSLDQSSQITATHLLSELIESSTIEEGLLHSYNIKKDDQALRQLLRLSPRSSDWNLNAKNETSHHVNKRIGLKINDQENSDCRSELFDDELGKQFQQLRNEYEFRHDYSGQRWTHVPQHLTVLVAQLSSLGNSISRQRT